MLLRKMFRASPLRPPSSCTTLQFRLQQPIEQHLIGLSLSRFSQVRREKNLERTLFPPHRATPVGLPHGMRVRDEEALLLDIYLWLMVVCKSQISRGLELMPTSSPR